ncbi:MAG: carboxyl-terminal processing protease [Candidatus Eremiobacteraeota bacterium]|jgi:carboxyl-terminal processing protease|nr:carboxyl-terminal processing protease [Candidatus Eremiobacteraeota bacterium]
MERTRIFAGAIGLIAAFVLVAPAPSNALSLQHEDDVRNGYQALAKTFYRGVEPAKLIAGARRAIADAYRKRGGAAPAFPSARPGEDTLAQIVASIDAARGRGPLSETDVTFAALGGMARAAGDKYTAFLTPKDLTGFQAPLNPAHVFGIGVIMQRDEATKEVSVGYVAPGTPADAAGVQNGDAFEAVDGNSVRGLDIPHVRALLLGRSGTVVRLRLVRDGKTREEFSVTRAEVHAPTVYQKMLPNGIGYIAVGVFGDPTAEEFGAALRHLQHQNARAYVIDLRNNGGGYVNAAVAIAGHFIHSGPIVSVATRTGTTQFDADQNADESRPVAVLVNHYSASASEITAGALQDSGVATLVGSRTYGKGVVQELTYNTDGSAMKVTTARYLTPRNRIIDGIGLIPDVSVNENAHARYGDPAADAQLAAAIGVVQAKARL